MSSRWIRGEEKVGSFSSGLLERSFYDSSDSSIQGRVMLGCQAGEAWLNKLHFPFEGVKVRHTDLYIIYICNIKKSFAVSAHPGKLNCLSSSAARVAVQEPLCSCLLQVYFFDISKHFIGWTISIWLYKPKRRLELTLACILEDFTQCCVSYYL